MSKLFARLSDLCSKPFQGLGGASKTDERAPRAEREGLALDPEVRREGPASVDPGRLSFAHGTKPSGKLQAADGNIMWTLDPKRLLIACESAATTPASPKTRASKRASDRTAASLNATFSEVFTTPVSGAPSRAKFAWRLVVLPFEYSRDAASAYLMLEDSAFGGNKGVEASIELATTHPDGHWVTMELEHTFTKEGSARLWGVQDMLALEDMVKLADQGEDLVIRLRLTLRIPVDESVGSLVHLQGAPDGIVIGEHDGREVVLISEQPRMVLIDRFLDQKQCEDLRALAGPLLQRSRVSSGTETKSRTSSGCFFTGKLESEPAVRSAEDAISRLIESDVLLRDSRGLTVRKRLNKTEALQAVHYAVGQEYKEHYDNRAGSVHLRAATVIVYVGRKCKEGGATHFPKALAVAGRRGVPGVRVYPREGRALVFWSRKEDGSEDHASLHAAEPVLSGEKWIVTRWLRETEAGNEDKFLWGK